MRVSEVCAISIHDFKKDYSTLTYRAAKTNKIINETLPPFLQGIVKEYCSKNMHRFKDGFIFPNHNGRGHKGLPIYSTETIGAYWTKWRRGCAKMFNNPAWLDKYSDGKHRISSHSLRRLHRTYIGTHINNDFLAAKLCHYDSVKVFQGYRDSFELENQRQILPQLMNPLLESLDVEFTEAKDDRKREAIDAAKPEPVLENN